MTIRSTILATLAASLALGAAAANAADYGPIYGSMLGSAPEIAPVEIGTGWYLRGDVEYGFDSDFDGFTVLRTPAGDFAGTDTGLQLDEGFGGGLGFGYQLTDYLRADLTARYAKLDVAGLTDFGGECLAGAPCAFGGTSELRSWDLMANAYVDLGTFAGFTPYVGGGVGAVNVAYEDVSASYCAAGLVDCAEASFDGEDSWRFAYALTAGLAYDVNRSLTLDVGYRYLDVDGGDMYTLPLASAGFADAAVFAEDDGFERHTITAGLRYKLW